MAETKQGKATARKGRKGRKVTSDKTGEPTGKEKIADQTAARKRGEAGLNVFGLIKGKMRAAFDEMAEQSTVEGEAREQKNMGALHLCFAAREYADFAFAKTTDRDTVLKDWKENIRQLTREMAADGHIFAEMGEARGDNPPTPKLTGHGKNVSTIARGIIECDVPLIDAETGEPFDSFTKVKNAVQAARLEQSSAEVQAFRAAVEDCREAFRDALKEAKKTERIESILFLTAAVNAAADQFAELNAEEPEEIEDLGEEPEVIEKVA